MGRRCTAEERHGFHVADIIWMRCGRVSLGKRVQISTEGSIRVLRVLKVNWKGQGMVKIFYRSNAR